MGMLTELNWLAIAVGTIFYCAFCGIWHRQFAFGKKWEEAMGFERSENWKETNIYYVVPLISCFVTTVVICACTIAFPPSGRPCFAFIAAIVVVAIICWSAEARRA